MVAKNVDIPNISLRMALLRYTITLFLAIFQQLIAMHTRSFTMYIMNQQKFQCVDTTCSFYSTIMVWNVHECSKNCVAQLQCTAATFHRSNSTCDRNSCFHQYNSTCRLFDKSTLSSSNLTRDKNTVALIITSRMNPSNSEYDIVLSQAS